MLKSITIENFFGFSEAQTIHLNPEVNVLVGINGSGKSNFIKAIRLLYEGVHGIGLQKLIFEEWGGLDNVLNYSKTGKDFIRVVYEFRGEFDNEIQKYLYVSYEITIKKSGISYVLYERLYNSENNDVYLNINNGTGYIYATALSETKSELINNFSYVVNGKTIRFNPQELIGVQLTQNLSFATVYIDYLFQNLIPSFSIYNNWDTTIQSQLRKPKSFNFDKKLNPNGENIVQVLNNLQSNHLLVFLKIEESLKGINPNFKNIHFSLIGSFQTMSLVERDLTKSVNTFHISDGTLRFLLLLSILYNPDRGTLVCLDEPEIGLHPDMINTIAEGIKYAAQTGTQMFIATHSPLLLNAFDLEDILIFEKDENNKSIVNIKSEEDFEDWQGEFLAGQMWLRGQLGGTRW